MDGVRGKYSYCSDTGNVIEIKSGKVANGKHTKGYIAVGGYLAHRVAWFLYYGVEPAGQIDHINQNKKDNRIKNLRVVTNKANHKNMPIQKNNTSGIVGVHYIAHKKRWVSYIKLNQKRIHIGTYADLLSACCARRSKEAELGFHFNHGKKL